MDKLYVEKLKDGRYRYRLRYVDQMGKAHRVNTIKNTNSKQAYNQALRELQGRVVRYDRLTLSEAQEMYLEDKARVCRPQTIQRNHGALSAVNQAIGDMPLEKLDALTLRRTLQKISPRNGTYNERLVRYKAFLNWCWQNNLIQDKWFDRIPPLPDDKKTRIADKYLEPEELQRLLEAMKVPMWYYLTYFLCLSGLRIGEAIALELGDVGKYISITKNYAINMESVGLPKTAESERIVLVQPELRKLLDRYMIFRSTLEESPLLFPGKDGYISYFAYNKYLRETSEKVLGRKITPHALRHTSASFLIANGVPLDSISRRLGHSDSKVTKQIYIHQTEKLQQMDDELISGAVLL